MINTYDLLIWIEKKNLLKIIFIQTIKTKPIWLELKSQVENKFNILIKCIILIQSLLAMISAN